jgi:replication factor C large subunit
MDWTEKYRPSTLSEVRGNNKARDGLKEWADTWEDHREAIVLHGTPGVGKTSAAHALANDMGWPTIELNASDTRTKDVIERVAGEAAKSGTLTAGGQGRRLVIMDEADNIHGNSDRGGARAIGSLVKEASQPMILIANEYYEMSNSLRNNCQDIEFSAVQKRSIVPVLRDICRKEDIGYTDAVIEDIAEQNSGDLRGAIKDLQATAEGRERIEADDYVSGERDTSSGIFEYLDVVLKEGDAEEALKGSYDVDETPDDLINWIEDNMPKDYEGDELARAYHSLSDADRWLGRVRATQNYSFWRYAGDAMTAGVAAARDGKKGGWTRYGPPSYWSKLGRSKGARNTRDYIARKIAAIDGVSMRTARREIMPFLATMTHHCKNRELTVAMAATYELETDHVSFVTGSGESTNKVQSIVEDAERLREEAAVEHSGGAFAGGTASGPEASEDEATDDDSGDAQSTLGGESTDDAEEADDDVDSDAAQEDDQQSGLSDFM